jgi:nicotinamide-nucleotide amidase
MVSNPATPYTPARARFELLTLGDELLLGLTANSHLAFIGRELSRRGVELARCVTVGDAAAAIAAEVRASWAGADVVILTGGLGPTCDDRTREVVAAVLGEELVFDPAIEHAIAERFARFGRLMSPNNRKQAFKFARGEVLPNAHGTAPGLWFAQGRKALVMLPGPPNELQPMFTEQVLPRLALLGLLAGREPFVQFRTAGVGESLLETKLQPLFDRYGDGLTVGFCAHLGAVDVRLGAADGRLDLGRLEQLAAGCERLLGEDFVCYGHDSLAKICADLLRAREKKLAVAEAATGGLLASALTEVCGACKFFAGGVVCCSNDAKIQLLGVPECLLKQHGAVSAECAVALATGAAEIFGADYALAITGGGAAGSTMPWGDNQPPGGAGPPGGGPAQDNPVGTMFLALHAPHGAWSKKISHPGPRKAARERAVNAALDWLRRELVRAPVGVHRPRADSALPA